MRTTQTAPVRDTRRVLGQTANRCYLGVASRRRGSARAVHAPQIRCLSTLDKSPIIIIIRSSPPILSSRSRITELLWSKFSGPKSANEPKTSVVWFLAPTVDLSSGVCVSSPPPPPALTNGPITGTYRLRQFHFHWGGSDERGSEHTVNNVKFPCEVKTQRWTAPKLPTLGYLFIYMYFLAPPGPLEHQVPQLWRSSQPAGRTGRGRGVPQGSGQAWSRSGFLPVGRQLFSE